MDKIQRSKEIENRISSFCKKHLTDEYLLYTSELSKALYRMKKLDITRGRVEIWAAAIVYVIARLNFLFDKESPDYITPDIICDFFGTIKSTTGNKATEIEKACNVHMGDPRFCRPDIADVLMYYRTPDGFIIPKGLLKNNEVAIEFMDEQEQNKFEAELKERQRKLEEEIAAKQAQKEALRKEKEAEKREKKHKDQIDLFGGK